VKLACQSYPSFAKVIVHNFSDHAMKAFGDVVKEEMVTICLDSANSKLKKKDVKTFSWDLIWSEVHEYMPRLTAFPRHHATLL